MGWAQFNRVHFNFCIIINNVFPKDPNLTSPTTYHFNLGNMACTAIQDGTEIVPIESVIKDVPAEALSQGLQANGHALTEAVVYFNCLLLDSGAHKVLVDAGWGQGTQRRNGALLDGLAAEGIAPGEIDTIVLTHGDVDHIGGIATPAGELVFPQANYVMLKEALEFWSNPAILSRWPEFLTVFGRKTLPLIRERVQAVEAGVEFLPGFILSPVPGHRPGHTALFVNSGGQRLMHLADTVGDALFFEHPDWHWYADFKPEQAEQDKTRLLDQAAAEGALVFGSHLPFPGVGRVTKAAKGWRWEPL
jgi:glyoxylase-like metal-dependent hydrolase (beta-lactamase superfamily II)